MTAMFSAAKAISNLKGSDLSSIVFSGITNVIGGVIGGGTIPA